MEKFSIAIPKPCHENWDTMIPGETGRFCGSCSKNVVDFTEKLPTDIQKYFVENQNSHVCGRFETRQLKKATDAIPEKYFPKFHYRFLLVLTLISSLLGCNGTDGKKKKTGSVGITPGTNAIPDNHLHFTLGIVIPPVFEMSPETYSLLAVTGSEPDYYVAPYIDEVKFVKKDSKDTSDSK